MSNVLENEKNARKSSFKNTIKIYLCNKICGCFVGLSHEIMKIYREDRKVTISRQ